MAEFTKIGGGTASSQHTFSEEEKVAFSTHINQCLGADAVLARYWLFFFYYSFITTANARVAGAIAVIVRFFVINKLHNIS